MDCPVKRLQAHLSALTSFAKTPFKVTVTGAAGNIGYALVFMIGHGSLLGPDQPIELTLLQVPQAQGPLKATIMQLQDSTLPLITKLRGSTDYKDGFAGCQLAILVGAKPRGPGMQRKDLLISNAQIFKDQGKAINDYADSNCKVVVVGNPANTNAMITATYAPKIKRSNFTALMRLDQNRAVGLLAERLSVPVKSIKNMAVWGNHSLTMVPDYDNAIVKHKETILPLKTCISDQKWLQETFVLRVQKRGQEVINLRKLSSAASAANAVCDHVRTWFSPEPSEIHSMAVLADENPYGISKQVCFSYPVVCCRGVWKIVEGVGMSEKVKSKVKASEKQLLEQRDVALGALK